MSPPVMTSTTKPQRRDSSRLSEPNATPFIKWAGGKTQLLPQLDSLVPKRLGTFYEPFVGSGAMFFWLRRTRGEFPAVLMDLNSELVNCYHIVRDNVDALLPLLGRYQEAHGKQHYYQVRDVEPGRLSNVQRAARFIYLNKTCYNGLYRVNSEGKFNVPIGSYKNPAVLEPEVLLAADATLQGVAIEEGDFSEILDEVTRGDFVYLDPPYYPISRTSSFTGYVLSRRGRPDFGAAEHQRLAQFFRTLDSKGCKVLLSNSDCEFVTRLYREYTIERVDARRSINSNGSGRSAITELVIRNY